MLKSQNQLTKKDKEVISDSSTTMPRSIHITFEATDVIGIDRLEFSLDGQAFSSCMGPVTYEKLRTSLHEFTAIAREGNRKHPKRQVYRNCHKVTLRLKPKKEDSHSLASRCFSLSFNNL